MLIECVPNVSEGRRPEVIEAISGSVSSAPGVILLDRSVDADHNRMVLTLAGSPEGLKEAILRLYAAALEHIDLREHRGSHPRMGAVDVVPFIPIRDATMEDCIVLANEVGQAVAEKFGVPVYLYGQAATSPKRRSLPNIRQGEFEGLAEKMADPAWKPDFGPDRPHPTAGASAIGARFFLLAYNLQLDTPDVKVADAVARSVRALSGGLKNVQAMGVFLADRNQAQVSMNLLNYAQTPLHRAQELVKAEARRYGARVLTSEIIGLIPQAALLEAAAYYLQVENWDPNLVLENAILQKQASEGGVSMGVPESGAAGGFARLSVTGFLDRLGAAQATPGGGSVAALAGALAAALVRMVSGLTMGKKGFEGVAEEMASLRNRGETLAAALTAAIDEDSAAYEAVMAAYGLPKGNDAEKAQRTEAIQAAMQQAAEVPLRVAEMCREAAEMALTALRQGNPNASSDGAVALLLALSGLEGAALNVATNLDAIQDPEFIAAKQQKLEQLFTEDARLRAAMWTAVRERIRSLPSS
ncbi:MAG TPA: glutamate formimidoyltransferase [Chthonomonadaceae bacterium]|nr:glutamate formimidoyltransferase [Chthonomonadaceae bacterium]